MASCKKNFQSLDGLSVRSTDEKKIFVDLVTQTCYNEIIRFRISIDAIKIVSWKRILEQLPNPTHSFKISQKAIRNSMKVGKSKVPIELLKIQKKSQKSNINLKIPPKNSQKFKRNLRYLINSKSNK